MPATPRRGKSVANAYESPAARCVSPPPFTPRPCRIRADLRYVRPPRGSTPSDRPTGRMSEGTHDARSLARTRPNTS